MKTYKPHLCYRGSFWWCMSGYDRGAGLSPKAAYDSMRAKINSRMNAFCMNARPQP
ncbi:hypothetical protein [Stenotrophomonas geniculata]|uniref:hypothetical protein n=1 Tax=Stenotrophomonas geniculata TaxID=86188 RepID=UPI003D9668D9